MKLKGIIDHIIFRNNENAYTVLSLNADDGGDYVCVGNLPELDPGENVVFEGEIIDTKKYGSQFSVTSYTIAPLDDEASVLRYLSSKVIKGIGPGLAQRIVSRFGVDSFRIIEEEPERLAEIKGISLRKAIAISESFEKKAGSRQALSFLSQYDISPALGQKIYERYKDRIYEIIKTNPYKLIEDIDGIGFITADRIAAGVGIEGGSEYRIRSAVLYILSDNLSSGSMCMPEKELTERAGELLGVPGEQIVEQLDVLAVERKLVRESFDGEVLVYAENSYYAEIETAKLLMDLCVAETVDEEMVAEDILKLELQSGISLEDSQREAVVSAVLNPVCVITGGPGTGKTTITNLVIRYFKSKGFDITLAAPTGRAAKRMTEATGYEAKTIHRLLGAGAVVDGKQLSGFEKNEDNPLETDVLILDEMSMVDTFVFRSLLRALIPGVRLILVGDADQLPSVGPGAVLKDIISSGAFNVTRLTRIYRQSEASAIVRNAHSVIEGRSIDLTVKSEDFFFLKRDDAERIIQGIIYLAGSRIPEHLGCDRLDIQVMTPMRKGKLGVENLNIRLQEALNPPGERKGEIEIPNGVIRVGDKVMQTRNDYDMKWQLTGPRGMVTETGTGIFNGDIGRVLSVSSSACYVRFDDGREAEYSREAVSELEPAYAITIHKSQGSEYRALILPLLTGPRMLMNRNLLYTAITRAKDMVCIIGSDKAVDDMIRNESEEKRYTGLKRRIQEIKDMGYGA